ncbi:hypothetical protein DYQ86_16615 [Acidobacteria bacterium AB60]|nr:hypothetical protein DYQ86_16615 [Acidobacteria bacterium AB60]
MSANTLPAILQNGNLLDGYKQLLDSLSRAYWEAGDMASKDRIYGAQQAVSELITALDQDDVALLTQQYIAMKPQIDATNAALAKIREDVNQITKNIGTASMLAAGITKVLGMFA